jgi:hypothetical protein
MYDTLRSINKIFVMLSLSCKYSSINIHYILKIKLLTFKQKKQIIEFLL